MATAKKRGSQSRPTVEASEIQGGPLPGMVDIPPAPRLEGGQTIYADQVGNVLFGLHTSRIVFANEAGTPNLEPVAEVVLPTAALLSAALNIVQQLSEPAMIEETAKRFSDQLRLMRSIRVKK